MARRDNLQVEVIAETADGKRTIDITATGETKAFIAADLLVQYKRLAPLTSILKNAVTEAINEYLESAEELISGKKETAGANDAIPKRARKNKDDAPAPASAAPADDVSDKGGRINGSTATFSGD